MYVSTQMKSLDFVHIFFEDTHTPQKKYIYIYMYINVASCVHPNKV